MYIRGRGFLCLAVLLMVSVSHAKESKHNKNAEITVEVKLALLDQAVVEQLKHHELLAKESTEKDVLALDNAQMTRFMELIQSSNNAKVMQIAPLTMGNGRAAVLSPNDEQRFVTGLEIVYRDGKIEYRPKSETIPLGWRITLHSIVSKDRRSVRVHLDANANNLESKRVPRFPVTTPAPDGKTGTVTHYIEQPRITKVAVNRTMVIPNGNTAVLTTGFKQHNVLATVSKIPGLGDLPWIGPRLFRTVAYDCRTIHLLVLVTPHIRVSQEKEERQSGKAEDQPRAIRPCRCQETSNDFRTLILAQYRENDPQCSEAPDEARILRALPAVKKLSGVYEESRDNIQIVTERLVDKIDPPRFFPLAGRAQLHHCSWKCTVYYTETIACGYPFAFRCTQPRKQVVYIDTDHLHTGPADKSQKK